MRYDDPELQRRLAGQYVLGALSGQARRRFEALMGTRPELRARVAEWEKDLAPLAEETVSIEPPGRILEHLEQRLDPSWTGPTPKFWRRLAFWRPFGVAAAALAVLLAGFTAFLGLRPAEDELVRLQSGSQPRFVAVLQDDTATPALVVTAYREPFLRLVVEPLGGLTIPADGVLRLWAIERESGAPYPLTSITGSAPFEQALSDKGWQHMETAQSLAVSREPAEGPGGVSATPLGPILYTGPRLSLKGPPET